MVNLIQQAILQINKFDADSLKKGEVGTDLAWDLFNKIRHSFKIMVESLTLWDDPSYSDTWESSNYQPGIFRKDIADSSDRLVVSVYHDNSGFFGPEQQKIFDLILQVPPMLELLQSTVDTIHNFEEDCLAAKTTDKGEAWGLLSDIRKHLQDMTLAATGEPAQFSLSQFCDAGQRVSSTDGMRSALQASGEDRVELLEQVPAILDAVLKYPANLILEETEGDYHLLFGNDSISTIDGHGGFNKHDLESVLYQYYLAGKSPVADTLNYTSEPIGAVTTAADCNESYASPS